MGVITMEGGMYQPLMIQPSQVSADGRYTTTRGITGVQTGAWTSTATVVTHPFNICLQDDSVPSVVVLWNTVTGDYIFSCPGCSSQAGKNDGSPSGKKEDLRDPTTGQSGTYRVATSDIWFDGDRFAPPGLGKVSMKGCIIVLQHNAPDRRVMANLDTCTKAGSATVNMPTTKTKFTITDRNIADNTCGMR